MKKLIAVLLCITCLVSAFGVTSFGFSEVITNIAGSMGIEPDEPIIYGIVYDSSRLSGVKIMYKPSPTFSFTKPGTYTVTDDIPLSVDYQFVCWEDDAGNHYYAGDKIYINGQLHLNAVWEEKTDNKSRPVRVIVTAFDALRRTINAFFGIYKVIYQEDPDGTDAANFYFDLDGLISEYHDYDTNKRYFEIAVKPCANGVTYDAFSSNHEIYLGGTIDSYGYSGGTEVSAYYEMTDAIHPATGTQYIKVTLTPGVPDPKTGQYVAFVLPQGLIHYTDAQGNVQNNNSFAFVTLTTKNTY